MVRMAGEKPSIVAMRPTTRSRRSNRFALVGGSRSTSDPIKPCGVRPAWHGKLVQQLLVVIKQADDPVNRAGPGNGYQARIAHIINMRRVLPVPVEAADIHPVGWIRR